MNEIKERPWIKWAKFGIDLVSLQASLFLACLICRSLGLTAPPELLSEQYALYAAGMLIIPVGYWLVRIYPGYGFTLAVRLRRRVQTTFVFFMLFMAWDFIVNRAVHTRELLLVTLVISLLIPPLMQILLRQILIRTGRWGTPVLVLGAGRTGQQVVKHLVQNPALGLHPVALLDDDRSKLDTEIAGVRVVGGIETASEFAGKINFVILAIPLDGGKFQLELACKLQFFDIIIVPDLAGIERLWVETRDMDGLIGLEIQKNLLGRSNYYLKTIMDYALGLPLFIISIPLVAFFAIWIFLLSPGNPFFSQIREGKGGRRFKLWKLRTMYPHAEKLLHDYLESNPAAKHEWHLYFKLKNDPRILRGIGTLLRKTSLDELPQLWNVLCGEMSLVGPRPFPHYHLEEFDAGFRTMRRSVLPGLTGLWQVSARSEGDLAVQEKLDTYYIRNWSIWLDLSLLGRTFWIVVTGKGAY